MVCILFCRGRLIALWKASNFSNILNINHRTSWGIDTVKQGNRSLSIKLRLECFVIDA